MYKYEDIAFRPINEDDLELIRKNRNDGTTLLSLGSVDLVSSIEHLAWWEKISRSKLEIWSCVVKEEYNNVIGVLRFQNIDYVNSICEIGADIFPEQRGKGYGKKTYMMALEYLFCHFNMQNVYLRVSEFNHIGLKLYNKIGFKECGRMPKSIFRNGMYWDSVYMFIAKDHYFKEINKSAF